MTTYQTKREAIAAANSLRAQGKIVKVMRKEQTVTKANKYGLPIVQIVRSFFLQIY